jgi:hypothetical protein
MADQPENKTGGRLVCTDCAAEFVVTRGGDGALTCCDKPLQARK